MQKPAWEECAFEGRVVRMVRLSDEEKIQTSWGTRFAVFASVQILDGLFGGEAYDRVPIFSPPLKAALLEHDVIAGRLRRGSRLKDAPVQWVLGEPAGQG